MRAVYSLSSYAWGYDRFSISPEIDAVIQEGILDVIAPYWAPQIQLLWDRYRDVHCPFEPIEAPAIVMKVLWNLPELLAYLHTWSATKQGIQQHGSAFFERLNERLLTIWQQPDDRQEVTMNFHMIVGRNSEER